MTLREFADALGVSRAVAGKLAHKIPGASREALRPGAIPSWVLPDDAPEFVTDDMIATAKAEAGETPAAPIVPSATSRVVSGSAVSPAAARLREEIEREQAAFELERLRDEKREWAARREEAERKRQAAVDTQRREAEARAAAEHRARQRERAEAERQQRRHAILQRAKSRVDNHYVSLGFEGMVAVPDDVRAAILLDVEKELTALPGLEELPFSEIERLTEGIRDRHVRPLIRERREAERCEAERRRQEAEQRSEESERRLAQREEENRREQARQALIEVGMRYAKEQLDDEDLGVWDRVQLERSIRDELERRIKTGEESRASVRKWVDQLLDADLE